MPGGFYTAFQELEPYESKGSSTVHRGRGWGNPPALPDDDIEMKKEFDIDKLERTSLSKEIVKISKPIFVDHIKVFPADMTLDWESGFRKYGKVDEIYAKQIFYSFVDLCESINKLQQNVTFLSLTNIPAYYKKNGISEIDYYKYHFENHYIKIVSIIDYTTKFIHDVFRLDMPIRKINVYLIYENLNTKTSKPAKILKKFDEHFKEIKTNRNIIIHQGNFKSKEITTLDAHIISIEVKDEIDKMIAMNFKRKKNSELKNTIDKIKSDNESVMSFIIDIFDGLTPHFTKQYDILKLKT